MRNTTRKRDLISLATFGSLRYKTFLSSHSHTNTCTEDEMPHSLTHPLSETQSLTHSLTFTHSLTHVQANTNADPRRSNPQLSEHNVSAV